MIEEWRPAPGFVGYYEVSNLGRVRSLSRRVNSKDGGRSHRGRIRLFVYDKNGYPRVHLCVDGQSFTRMVHRLVCEAFHGPSNILHTEVDHIDHDTGNASADNLRWVSRAQNMALRRSRKGQKGEKNPFSKLTEAAVLNIRAQPFAPAKRLAATHGVTIFTIYDVRLGRSWAHLLAPAPNPTAQGDIS